MRACICDVCSAPFTTKQPRRRYCSRRCAKRAEKIRYTSVRVPAVCRGCGCEFQQPRGVAKVYCSTTCQYEARSREYSERGIRPPLRMRDVGNYYAALKADPCAYCGAAGGAIDHVDPRSRGGANHWENYAGVCTSCNTTKRDRPLLAFLGWRSAAAEFDAWRDLCGDTATSKHRAKSARAGLRLVA